MEKENIFITGEIHFLELIEKKSSSLVFKGPNDEEISCNESDVDSLDDFEIGEEYSMFVYPSRSGKLFATPNIPEVTYGEYAFSKVVKVEEDRVGLDIGFSREIPLLGEDLPKVRSVWPKEGDELFITLRRDYSGQLFARLATETVVNHIVQNKQLPWSKKTLKLTRDDGIKRNTRYKVTAKILGQSYNSPVSEAAYINTPNVFVKIPIVHISGEFENVPRFPAITGTATVLAYNYKEQKVKKVPTSFKELVENY